MIMIKNSEAPNFQEVKSIPHTVINFLANHDHQYNATGIEYLDNRGIVHSQKSYIYKWLQ